MVKQFKNRVRIADVQKEFDTLCSRIDNLNQKIQDVTEIGEDFDYSEGSSQLAAAGYTLTVGGLKKALEACDGTVLGARAFRVNDSHIKMSGGYLITKDGGYRLPDSYLTIPQRFRTLYFNPETKQYQWTARGSEIIIVEETKSLTDKSCLQVQPISDENNFFYKYSTDRTYNNIYGSSVGNPGQLPTSVSLRFDKTPNLSVINTNELTYDTNNPDKVRVNIADYVYLADRKVSLNDTISADYTDGTLGINNIILGTLSDNGTYFTPKLVINIKIYAGGGYNLYLQQSVLGMTNNPTITPSLNGDNNKVANVSFNLIGGVSPVIDSATDLGYAGMKYKFEYDSLLANPYRLKITTIHNGGELVQENYITMPDNIENYNINCIIFDQLKSNYYPNSEYEVSSTDPRYNPLDPTSPYVIYHGNYISPYNKLIKSDDSIVELAQDYTYTEWVEREVEGDDAAYKICDVNMNRGSIYANDHFGVQNENIYGTYEISIPNRTYGSRWDSSASTWLTNWLDWANLSLNMGKAYEAISDTHEAKFVVPTEGYEMDDGVRYEAYFYNQRIACNKSIHRGIKTSVHLNYLFLPRNVANPFNYRLTRVGWNTQSRGEELSTDPTKCSNQKVYNVKISKKLKQKTL